ncbi:lamin tail domain-containing protein [Hymenobacter lutimineralis]|nr:lamin tail domain-containing protein [Hymenobacter lutimineralis]
MALVLLLLPLLGWAQSTTVVISQVYGGGGGTSTSPSPSYKYDFVEIFNKSSSEVTLDGKSIQYAPATGTTGSYQIFSFPTGAKIGAGKYYLVRLATATGATGADITNQDASGVIAMSGTAGRVALVANTTALAQSTTIPNASVIDFVGYGTNAIQKEGTSTTANLSTTTAAIRGNGGCDDTDQNGTDFTVATPVTPRNSGTTANPCGGSDTTPPTFATGSPSTSAPTGTGFTLSSTINEVGKTYYVVLADGATAPTAAQVKAASGTPLASGNFTNPTANTAATSVVGGLSASTAYDVYVVAEDNVPNLQASPVKLDVTTGSGAPVPTISPSGAALTAFNTVASSPSAEQSFTVSATNLTANVVVQAPTGYEVSQSSGSGFGTSTSIAFGSGTLTNVPVYVRLSGAGSGTVAGSVTLNSTGAAEQTKAVTGTVVAEPTTAPTVSAGTPTQVAVTLTVGSGNGSKRLLVVRAATTTAVAPTDKTAYTANLAFGSGATTGTGNFVVLNGTGTSAAVTGLTAGTNYVAEVYAYNESSTAGFENYLQTPLGSTTFTTLTAPLLVYDFTAGATPSTQNANVTGSAFSRKNVTSSTASGRYSSSNWSTTATIDTSKYVQFAFNANSGYMASLTTLTFVDQSSGTGPNKYEVRSSLDNFATALSSGSTTGGSKSVTLSGFTNLIAKVTFRFYAAGSSATGGTYSVDDVNLYGTVEVSTVPTVATGTISPTSFCVGQGGAAVSVPFTSTNTFTTGNVYTAYIVSGGVSTAIGSVSSTANSGTISGTIPTSIATGTSYRIRVDASAPATTGTDNGADLSVVNYATNEVMNPTAVSGNQQVTLSWTNPTSCFSRVVIVARAGSSVTVKPSGSFTANTVFGSGTNLGTVANPNQYVVYSGTGTSATVTGLTNGTEYFFTIYTTNESGYSNGLERSASPAAPVTLTEVVLPQYLVARTGTSAHDNRVPYAYRATLSGLIPNATYRYHNGAIDPAVDNTSATGSGNSIFATTAGAFVRTGSKGFTTAGNYGELQADASGNYTGWFVLEPTSNAVFEPGDVVQMRIVLNNGNGGTTPVSYLTTTSTVSVVSLGTSATDATAVYGNSGATASNFVLTYDNETGSGRPLYASFVESDGSANTLVNNYAAFYANNVEGVTGAWGAITPNNNANGIRRIEQRSLQTGAVVGCIATDADGTWPSGVVTASPAGGTTALVITTTDAPLSCEAYVSFIPNTLSVTEGNSGTSTVSVNVTVANTPASPLEVTVSNTGTGTATAGSDFTFLPQTLTFNTAGTQTVTLTIKGDTDIETNETVVLGLAVTAGGPATVVNSTATVTIVTDDTPSFANVLLLEENFDYAASTTLTTTASADAATKWAVHSGSTTNSISTVADNLLATGYPQGIAAVDANSSSKASLKTNGQDINRAFAVLPLQDKLYASALVQVSAAQASGDYFLHFAEADPAVGNLFRGRVFARSSGTGINFGLSVGSGTASATYSTTVHNLATTYLVVLKYETKGTAETAEDDVVSLYVFDAADNFSTEPTTPFIGPLTDASLTAFLPATIALRQGSASGASATLTVDNLRVATGWGAAVGQVEITSPSYVNPGNYYSLKMNGGTGYTTTTLTGASTTPVVEHALTLTSGVLNTNDNALKLNNLVNIFGGNSTSYIEGPLARMKVAGAGTLMFPVGQAAEYRPLTLNITTQANAATYTATQHEGAPANQNFGSSDIKRVSTERYYTVAPATEPGAGEFAGTITLSYDAYKDGVNAPNAPSLVIAKSHAGGAWEDIGQSATSATTVTSDPFTSFSDFVLASTDASINVNPLPVQLTAFSAAREGAQVQVQWVTASERNSARFEVERSADGVHFTQVGRVNGQGSTTARSTYRFADAKPLSGVSYYRLRQVDQDGTAHLSEVRTVQGGKLSAGIYPNPVASTLYLQLPEHAGAVQAIVTDLAGREVYRAMVPASQQLDLRQLPQGSYVLVLQGAQLRSTHKLVKTN